MTSQPGLQTIPIHTLPNISQSKGNQTMKFSPFLEYNKINFIYLFTYLFIYLSIYLSIYLFIYLFIYLLTLF